MALRPDASTRRGPYRVATTSPGRMVSIGRSLPSAINTGVPAAKHHALAWLGPRRPSGFSDEKPWIRLVPPATLRMVSMKSDLL